MAESIYGKNAQVPEGETVEKEEYFVGRIGPINTESVQKANTILEKYKQGKKNLEERIKENEEWWRMRHWNVVKSKSDENDPKPASAWLFNSIMNKHADAMDNYPSPNILPKERTDESAAETLTEILPVVLENTDFEKTYNDAWWNKLKTGASIYGVFWDAKKDGVGDIVIKEIDALNIFWEPGITDIQNSKNLFIVSTEDKESILKMYPFLPSNIGDGTVSKGEYALDDNVDMSDKLLVIDWYYKQVINVTELINGLEVEKTQQVLHFCKYVGNEVIYATENDPELANVGLYNHGKYPIEFDSLFNVKGSPFGFGYIDIMKQCQLYIDKMDQIIIRNAQLAGVPRWFVSNGADINEEEFTDFSKQIIHVEGMVDDSRLKQFTVNTLDAYITNHMQNKIAELKETSGNRDFVQGGTASGVTAASAIYALQEAGNKLSRDNIKASYRSYRQIIYLCIELIRQFYDETRCFRIIGDNGKPQFIDFNNASIKAQDQNEDGLDLGTRTPIFDISVSAEKQSPFSRMAQNELAKELFGAGFFNPQLAEQSTIAMGMMQFEGKDEVIEQVRNNSLLMQQVQQMQQQMMQLAQIVDIQNGSTITQGMQQEGFQIPSIQPQATNVGGGSSPVEKIANGDPDSIAGKAKQAAEQSISAM